MKNGLQFANVCIIPPALPITDLHMHQSSCLAVCPQGKYQDTSMFQECQRIVVLADRSFPYYLRIR